MLVQFCIIYFLIVRYMHEYGNKDSYLTMPVFMSQHQQYIIV